MEWRLWLKSNTSDYAGSVRRQFENKNKNTNTNTNTRVEWTTAAITPGTKFMETLSDRIRRHFTQKNESGSGSYKIRISCSKEAGEGEHKLFEFIRSSPSMLLTDECCVYGLDSDLIMLSIFHVSMCKNIYVFRESPEFMKSDISMPRVKDGFLFMDIDVLSKSLSHELSYNSHGNTGNNRMHDYIFMCFFLGNDFLPRFPALNIRTNGFQILIDTYKMHMSKYANRVFILDGQIQWKWVHLFVNELAKQERGHIQRELDSRNKFSYITKSNANQKTDLESIINDVPIFYRGAEKYISPKYGFWEERYYRALLHGERSQLSKEISRNYLEGLEWVYKYYTIGCVDWSWKYKYHYPPLLTDLSKNIPNNSNHSNNYVFGNKKEDKHDHDVMGSLRYVLAKRHRHLIPESESGSESEPGSDPNPEWEWAFKRYFWEGSMKL